MTQQNDEPRAIEGEEVLDVSENVNVLATLNRSEIDMQISTAKKYPRSIAQAKRRMTEMATIDTETAKSCGYALKRNDKGKVVWIEGPSIRMAEIAVACWGNLRYGARVIEETERFIVAQGVCHDLENNVYNAIEVRRRITTRDGKKFGDDMVGVTANAACAIAQRNAVFKVIPRAIINPVYQEAMRTAFGDAKTFQSRRENAAAEFKKLDVTIEEILTVLGKPTTGGLEDIDTTDLRRLYGLLTAITDGEATVDQIFRPQTQETPERKSGAERTKDILGTMRGKSPDAQPAGDVAGGGPTVDTGEQGGSRPTGGGEPAKTGNEPSGTSPNVGTWDATRESLIGAAQDAALPEGDLWARVNLWLLSAGAKGKEESKTKPKDRLALIAAVREGRLMSDGKIVETKQ
jgi:hypothetical protein